MSDGQHVGAVRDQVAVDAAEQDARELARAQAQAAKQAVKPQKARGGISTGDGDACPLFPDHGRMLTIPGTQRQQCPHQGHDGRPKSHPLGATPTTPRSWPLGTLALAEAVRVYTTQQG